MKTGEELKQVVKEKYSEIALQSKGENASSCCGATCCSTVEYAVFAESYNELKGYAADADLGLGCGLPTEFAKIKKGDTVIDLGSGAGNDCFVARAIAGAEGKIIGIDMTDAMIEKARANAEKLGFNNVEFRLGDIENLPVTSSTADVIVSNCVLNLVPDKVRAFSEIFRVLKPGAHFSISDVVLVGELPSRVAEASEMYAGCVSGAIQKGEYLDVIKDAGFVNIAVQKEKAINVPDDILKDYLSPQEIELYRKSGTGIYSITVYGEKPSEAKCCEPGCCS